MSREKLQISLSKNNVKNLDKLAECLKMKRTDVLEVVIAFYFAYVNCNKAKGGKG